MNYMILFFTTLFIYADSRLFAKALNNEVQIKVNGPERCIKSNGIPDHSVGQFPNRGNPHTISVQKIFVCIPIKPELTEVITPVNGTMGIAINGILFRPNTAKYWDPESPRGHSNKGDKNWRLNLFGTRKFGLDSNNGHIGPGGLYHYHGIAKTLNANSGSSLVGYAADGFEIHFLGDKVSSGWALKKGYRQNGPGGKYDGKYNQDYIYIEGKNKLDQCNGGFFDSKYMYFITNEYPFIPLCLRGKVSDDFNENRSIKIEKRQTRKKL